MSVDIKTEGLSEFSKELMDLANKKFPKDTKNFLQKVLRKAQRTSLKV